MASTAVRSRNTINLKGSAVLVSEYFNFAVNNILYQRGIYPPDSFKAQLYYGLSIMVTKDRELKQYLDTVMGQMQVWLEQGTLQRVVVVITHAETNEVIERWTFSVQTDKPKEGQPPPQKEADKIRSEMAAVMRQITGSVSFLPLMDDPCTFDLLAYTSMDQDVPTDWEESDAKINSSLQEFKYRMFSTKVHTVATSVAYKQDAAGEDAAAGGAADQQS